MTTTTDNRQVRHLAILRHAEEVTGNVLMTCRYYGITRQSSYVWKRRYDEFAPEGLKDHSSRPKVSPRATHVDVVGRSSTSARTTILGPAKIAMYLKRYHDVAISPSGVWRILKRLQLNRLPALKALQAPGPALAALREAAPRPPGRMSRVPWNFGGGPVMLRRLPSHHRISV